MTAPTTAAIVLTEAQWQQQVINLARVLNWDVYHTRYSLGSQAGFPDLTLVKPGRKLVFLELKRESGKASPSQLAWIARLNETDHAVAMVAKPSDWDVVTELLQRGEDGDCPRCER